MTTTKKAALLAALWAMASATASADYAHLYEPARVGLNQFEMVAGFGVVGRMSSGRELVGYGYDHEAAPATDLSFRFLFGDNRYVRAGFTLRGGHQRGRGFGRQGHAYGITTGELMVTARTIFPCMSNGERAIFFAANVGVSTAYHDASSGRGPMNSDVVAREAAVSDYDHTAVGYVLGVDLSMHVRHFLVGVAADLRQQFGVGTGDRHFAPSLMLRVGWALDLRDEPQGL